MGSANWGMQYGLSSLKTQVEQSEVKNLLKAGEALGVNLIDTASLYGSAEKVLGQNSLKNFKVVTKTPHFNKLRITLADAQFLKSTFKLSLERLNIDRSYGLLFHRAEDILKPGKEYLIECITQIKEDGMVSKIGVSIYSSFDIIEICDTLEPDIVQLPLNIFDQRVVYDGTLKFLKSRNIEIHSRSVFMQGLLLMPVIKMPNYFLRWKKQFKAWFDFCRHNNLKPFDVALNFVGSIREIDKCIIGFSNCEELRECQMSNLSIQPDDLKFLHTNDIDLINPSRWFKNGK